MENDTGCNAAVYAMESKKCTEHLMWASTEITKKNRQSHSVTETFTPFGHFFLRKMTKKP